MKKMAQGEITRKMAEAVALAVLTNQGYEVEKIDDYIHAVRKEKDLLIFYAGHVLSNVAKPESTTMEIEQDAVIKLEQKATELNCVSCLAYFIGKYDIKNLELCIVPSQVIKDYGKKRTQYSYSSNNYHYNYAKVNGNLPDQAILRAVWSGDIFE